MFPRSLALVLTCAVLPVSAFASAPAAPANVGTVVTKEVNNLSADDFAQRDAALKRLQSLMAEQLKQRAQIQEVLSAFQLELAQQQKAMAMVSEEEAQAQIAGLLEMERGLTGWTIQTMGEPAARRKQLLDWGLTKEKAPMLARVYADSLRARVEGIKQLAKSNDEGASWTLGRLINDRQAAVRAAGMAACWSRAAHQDTIDALWFRAVTGPLASAEQRPGYGGGMMPFRGGMAIDVMGMPEGMEIIKVDFPGGDPMEFDDSSDASQFTDSQIAADVLIHLNSPLVGQKVKALVEDRAKSSKPLALSQDPDWTLVSHRLIETYQVKEAIPLLATEALGSETEDMGGDWNGRPYMWSRRSMAIGTLAKLIGKEPADFNLIRARDVDGSRGWAWGVEINQQALMNGNVQDSDGPAVRAFYAFWKDHHAEYGVKEEPSNASVPPVPQPGQVQPGFPRRFPRGVINGPAIDPAIEPMPLNVPEGAPGVVPGAAPAAPAPATPPAPRPVPAGAAG